MSHRKKQSSSITIKRSSIQFHCSWIHLSKDRIKHRRYRTKWEASDFVTVDEVLGRKYRKSAEAANNAYMVDQIDQIIRNEKTEAAVSYKEALRTAQNYQYLERYYSGKKYEMGQMKLANCEGTYLYRIMHFHNQIYYFMLEYRRFFQKCKLDKINLTEKGSQTEIIRFFRDQPQTADIHNDKTRLEPNQKDQNTPKISISESVGFKELSEAMREIFQKEERTQRNLKQKRVNSLSPLPSMLDQKLNERHLFGKIEECDLSSIKNISKLQNRQEDMFKCSYTEYGMSYEENYGLGTFKKKFQEKKERADYLFNPQSTKTHLTPDKFKTVKGHRRNPTEICWTKVQTQYEQPLTPVFKKKSQIEPHISISTLKNVSPKKCNNEKSTNKKKIIAPQSEYFRKDFMRVKITSATKIQVSPPKHKLNQKSSNKKLSNHQKTTFKSPKTVRK